MNAHTQFPSTDTNASNSAEIREEIESIDLGDVRVEGSANSIAQGVNDVPIATKFKLYNRSVQTIFAVCAIAACIAVLEPGWAFAMAITVALTAIAGIVWVAVAGNAMDRDMVRPLIALIDATERAVNGERSFEFPGLDRKDEVGRFSRIVRFLAKAGAKMDELYVARKTADVAREETEKKRKQELIDLAAQLEANISQVAGGVAAAAEQLTSSAKVMSNAADDAIVQIGDIAEAMDQVAQGTTSAASASDEFALSIEEISRQAANSADLARVTNEAASGTDATMLELSSKAEGIGQIAGMIDTIAGRTNLLALNASIEAARGGETGRGFAVVASEVKELASQTSRATGDVTGRITEMQEQSEVSITQLRAISEQVSQLEIASVAIASAVDQQSVAGKELAMNVDLAANGAGEVSATTGKLRETALAAGSAASQVLSSSNELHAQATNMQQKVSEFLEFIRSDGSY